MPPVVMTMSKQAINANANLHAVSFIDADMSIRVLTTDEAIAARKNFQEKRAK